MKKIKDIIRSLQEKNAILPLIISISIVLGMLGGRWIAQNEHSQPEYIVYPERENKIDEVLHYIENSYVDTVNLNILSETAINAILDSLDPHSVYVKEKRLKRANEPLEGKFSGIGIQFNMQEDTIMVVKTISNGPSEKVGLQAGDRIVEINDSLVAGVNMPTNEIVDQLKGTKGTSVEVGVLRKGEDDLIDFTIVRDDIPLYSIDVSYMLNDNVGFIKISNFSRTTYNEFISAIDKLRSRGMEKLVLDVRGNGGGYLQAAHQVADEFLEKGKLIVYTEGKSSPRQEFLATKRGKLKETPTVILIDEWSASASEIVAGALQDNDQGTIVGRRSFGKGLVQQQIMLSDGSALRLTVARYYTPTGRSIQKPYNNGEKDYFEDVVRRYEHGEFFEVDSIDFPDSLLYETPGGKVVYGGGGIMPDVFVPKDTSNYTPYLSQVTNRGMVYRFAFDYADEHRTKMNQFEDIKALEEYLDQNNILDQFTIYAQKKGVEPAPGEIKESSVILNNQIKAYIARNVLDSKGFYPIIGRIDQTLKKAIELLETKEPPH